MKFRDVLRAVANSHSYFMDTRTLEQIDRDMDALSWLHDYVLTNEDDIKKALDNEKEGTMTYANLREVLDANDAAGQHFFDADTMEFFNSKLESDLIDGRFFITSERFDSNTAKQYTIRAAQDDGAIVTLGDFGQYQTLQDAKDVLAGGMT